jgi:hypothetical protein
MKRRFARIIFCATLTAGALLGLHVDRTGVTSGQTIARADGDLDLTDLLAKIAAARSKLRTVRTDFTQVRTIGLLSSKVRSQGQLTLVMPDRLRWELYAPDAAVYWVGPEGVSYKSSSGSGSVPRGERRVTAALDDLRTLLGGDLSNLSERYVLRAHAGDSDAATAANASGGSGADGGAALATGANGGTNASDLVTLEAKAKDASHGLRGFALTWSKADLSSPVHATLLEAGKDRSDIVFAPPLKDGPVDPATMRP